MPKFKKIIPVDYKEIIIMANQFEELGMSKEEVYRLSDLDREAFLKLITAKSQQYSKARIIKTMV